jgi:hypothetical protein
VDASPKTDREVLVAMFKRANIHIDDASQWERTLSYWRGDCFVDLEFDEAGNLIDVRPDCLP